MALGGTTGGYDEAPVDSPKLRARRPGNTQAPGSRRSAEMSAGQISADELRDWRGRRVSDAVAAWAVGVWLDDVAPVLSSRTQQLQPRARLRQAVRAALQTGHPLAVFPRIATRVRSRRRQPSRPSCSLIGNDHRSLVDMPRRQRKNGAAGLREGRPPRALSAGWVQLTGSERSEAAHRAGDDHVIGIWHRMRGPCAWRSVHGSSPWPRRV